ncbi:hypothetical protein LIA77_03069 [Sarocladium implicatum]|nr:hypothetical protein LIA77_03069 [Sarocladium implicatum]
MRSAQRSKWVNMGKITTLSASKVIITSLAPVVDQRMPVQDDPGRRANPGRAQVRQTRRWVAGLRRILKPASTSSGSSGTLTVGDACIWWWKRACISVAQQSPCYWLTTTGAVQFENMGLLKCLLAWFQASQVWKTKCNETE